MKDPAYFNAHQFFLVGCKMNSDTNDKNNGKFVDISNESNTNSKI